MFGTGALGVFAAEPISNLIGGLACFLTMMITLLPELNRNPKEEKQVDSRTFA